MRPRMVWAVVGVVVLSAIVGCRKSEDGPDGNEQTMAEQVKQQAGRAMETATNFVAENKDRFIEASQQQLDQLQQKYQQWKQQATVESEQARQKLSQLQADFEKHLKTVSESLDKAKDAGADAWRATAATLQEALTGAQSAFDQLVSFVTTQGPTAPPTEQE